jgi:hypothetical protein
LAGGFSGLTGLRPEGCGGAFGHAFSGVRVQRVQKVQKVQRVVVSPCRTMNIKSALRDLPSRPASSFYYVETVVK